jgi:hypothetical protein
MNHPDPLGRPPADEALDGVLDETDLALLDEIREMFAEADPMPADLPERIRFSLALRDLDFEVARLSAELDQTMLAARGTEQSRTITFDSDSLTIMIRVDSNQDGTARVDGWLAPPQARTIELRTMSDTLTEVADDGGRFVFGRIPHGSAQLVVRAAPDADGSGQVVVTPALIL